MPYSKVPEDVLQRWLDNAEVQLGFWKDALTEHAQGVERAKGQIVNWNDTTVAIKAELAGREHGTQQTDSLPGLTN